MSASPLKRAAVAVGLIFAAAFLVSLLLAWKLESLSQRVEALPAAIHQAVEPWKW